MTVVPGSFRPRVGIEEVPVSQFRERHVMEPERNPFSVIGLGATCVWELDEVVNRGNGFSRRVDILEYLSAITRC